MDVGAKVKVLVIGTGDDLEKTILHSPGFLRATHEEIGCYFR
jgi:hypothetical protein